jgi:hypothetical protein
VRSWCVLLRELAVDGVAVDLTYADLFLVVREPDEGAVPGPSDWEATLRTPERQRLGPGRHELLGRTVEGHEVQGWAVIRFSDGHQHLFRGDGELAGAAAVVAPEA